MITFSVINAQKKCDNIVRNFNTFWNKKSENPLILGRKSAIIRLELNDNSQNYIHMEEINDENF